jgi:hypothetical protein
MHINHFSWQIGTADELDIMFEVRGEGCPSGWRYLHAVELFVSPLFPPMIVLHGDEGPFWILTSELDADSKARARSLLKHLGYKRMNGDRWYWSRLPDWETQQQQQEAANRTQAAPVIACTMTGTQTKVILQPFFAPPAASSHPVPLACCI